MAGDYPKPESLLNFIELPQFTRRWAELGLDDERELATLQLSIINDPKSAAVIEGTHGLRKGRYSPSKWNVGKSGATRVLYVYFEPFGIVLLCLIYRKNEMATISTAVKKQINRLIDEIEQELLCLRSAKN